MSELATRDIPVSGRVESPSQGVLLLVRQMAASGIGHGEITVRLRDDFGVQHAVEVVNSVFAPRGDR